MAPEIMQLPANICAVLFFHFLGRQSSDQHSLKQRADNHQTSWPKWLDAYRNIRQREGMNDRNDKGMKPAAIESAPFI